MTSACSIWYLTLLAPALQNSFLWSKYNQSGYDGFVVDLINTRLMTQQTLDLNFFYLPSSLMANNYNDDEYEPHFESIFARRVMYNEIFGSLRNAIVNMRATVQGQLSSIYVQYCWVDFRRRWDIAHTSARSARCEQRYRQNGDAYMETMARNVVWNNFLAANNRTWWIVIGSALNATTEGQKWIAERPFSSIVLSVDEELEYLKTWNITKFRLQWQNEVQYGLTDSIAIENALGLHQTISLKSTTYAWGPWTSGMLFWNFRNDLGNFGYYKMSLVRGASNYFEKYTTFSHLYGLDDRFGYYEAQAAVFVFEVSPLGSVDPIYVPIPAAFVDLHQRFISEIYSQLWSSPDDLKSFESMNTFESTPMPPQFDANGELLYHGGNLLCLNNVGTPYPQSQIAFDDTCAQQRQLTIRITNIASLFALLMSEATNMEKICNYQTKNGCLKFLLEASQLLRRLKLRELLKQWINNAHLHHPDARLVQYVNNLTSGDWGLLQQTLIDPQDNEWSFYGWVLMLDWIEGKREIIQLDGDVSTIIVISDLAPKNQVSTTSKESDTGPKILFYLMVYSSALTVLIALMVLAYSFGNALNINGTNLFAFNRVVGSVWIGRPLLIVRGMTAIAILSTSPTLLEFKESYSTFAFSPRSPADILLIAGEATWISYVLGDISIVFTKQHLKYTARIASAIAWIITMVIEFTDPVRIISKVSQQCTVDKTNEFVQCNSGTIQVGDYKRSILLVCIQIASFVFCLGGRVCFRIHKIHVQNLHCESMVAPSLLHGSAESFLSLKQISNVWEIDDIACIMSGLIPLGHHYLFDIKLWVVVKFDSSAQRVFGNSQLRLQSNVVAGSTMVKPHCTERSRIRTILSVVFGMLYVLVSASGSVSYIALTRVNLANDFYWATFNLTGHHAAIGVWYYEQVSMNSKESTTDLIDRDWISTLRDYSKPTSSLLMPQLFGSNIFAQMTSLSLAIQGLRQSHVKDVVWIASSYCWLDFNRQWPMAKSVKRQQRCESEVENGGIYLESVLRNVDWDEFKARFGYMFQLAFEDELARSESGKKWLSDFKSRKLTTLEEELAHWTSYGITKFSVQWQNYKTLGFASSYSIQNSFGVNYPMTIGLERMKYRLAEQTSNKMYWSLAVDFWFISQFNSSSLLRTSSAYLYDNMTLESVLASNQTISLPLNEAFTLVKNYIGPFGAVDIKTILCPRFARESIAEGYAIFRQSLTRDENSLAKYNAITSPGMKNLRPLPTKFKTRKSWLTSGGNLLCPDYTSDSIGNGLFVLTSKTGVCDQITASTFIPSKESVLVAAIMAGINPEGVYSVCGHEGDIAACLRYLGMTAQFIDERIPENDLSDLAHSFAIGKHSVAEVNASIMQYARLNETEPMTILTSALFDGNDPTYDFWSWIFVLDWATGAREVISFYGDAGSINVMSEFLTVIIVPIQSHELRTTFALCAQGAVQYVTGVMLCIAVWVGIYIVFSRGQVEGLNIFELNRVGGIVWIGRPLLLIRGITALCLLSTATLELQYNGMTQFVVPALPWYKVILGVSETTWLVYILNDIVMVWSREYTLIYATGSSLVVWFTASIVTLWSPVKHQVDLKLNCVIEAMDSQLRCDHGVIYIGHVTRFYLLLGIIAISNIVCFIFSRFFRPRYFRAEPSFLLSSGAKYLFDRSEWIYNDTYFLDGASALLNGLISCRWGPVMYVMDIKLWRCFCLPMPADLPFQFAHAVPLLDRQLEN